jgi:hypothetical protein
MEAHPVQTQSPDMSAQTSAHGGEPSTESPLHEHSHISLRALVHFFIWFFIAIIIVEAFVYGLFRLYRHQAAKTSVPITGLSAEDVTHSIPPEPRLQPSVEHDVLPRVDLQTMHDRDMAEFRKRGWADDKGEVKIPDSIAGQVEQMSQPAARRIR